MVEITPHDVLEKAREAIGEDPLTGVAPVEVVQFDWELDLNRDDDSTDVIELKQLQKSEARRRVGRIPCEAIYYLLVAKVGPKWWHLEWEVLIEELAKDGYFFDGAGHAKVMALWTVLRAPLDNNPFYRNWQSFLFLTCALMGRPIKWGELAIPTPVEIALSAHICLEFRPHSFSPQVLGTIASCCLYHGMWCLPEVLEAAQEAMYQNLQYLNIPLGSKDVQEVLTRTVSLLKEKKTSNDALDPDEDGLDEREEILRIQTIRVLDFNERFTQLYDRGEAAKELVLETLETELQDMTEEKET